MENNNVLILHISDLHFGDRLSMSLSRPDFTSEKLAEKIGLTILKKYPEKNIVIAISGDITTRGNINKYQESLIFLTRIKEILSTDKNVEFIICPGNHDLNTSSSPANINGFNRFTYDLTQNSKFIFESNHSILCNIFNWSFMLINTQYHLDHTYGLIDMDDFSDVVIKARYPIVILMHHHLIPIFLKNVSTIRNSYPFIQECLKNDIRLILHGHVHSSFKLSFCKPQNKLLHIIGVGSLLSALETNYNNQFNVILLREKIQAINYIIRNDSDSSEPGFIEQIVL